MHDADSVADSIKSSGSNRAGAKRTFLFVIIFASFAPLLSLHFSQLLAFEHYGFFPLVLIALPFLLWHLHLEPAARPHGQSPHWEHLAFSGGFLLLLFAVVAWSPNVAAVATVVTAGGALLHYSRLGRIRRPLAIWLLLLLLVKLPLNIDLDLIFWLQGWNSEVASRLLDILGINHVLRGHVIHTADEGFLVEEACSGIQSLFTIIAAAGIALVLVERSLFHSVLMLLFAAFWACMINTIRISSVVLASIWFQVDISAGLAHEALGIVLLASQFFRLSAPTACCNPSWAEHR